MKVVITEMCAKRISTQTNADNLRSWPGTTKVKLSAKLGDTERWKAVVLIFAKKTANFTKG